MTVEEPTESTSQGKLDARCGNKDSRILSITTSCPVKSCFIHIIKWYDLPSYRRSGKLGRGGKCTSY